MTKILITGGLGYISSNSIIELLKNDFEIIVIDNLSNCTIEILSRLKELTSGRIEFHEMDIRNNSELDSFFSAQEISSVIHYAGLKSVSESTKSPIKYYDNNVSGTISLLNSMVKADVKNLVFSSSATVYGVPNKLPISESEPRSTTNPYGRSKLMVEQILEDLAIADPSWNIACLRYFNPVGAHKSGLIGEDPKGTPNNIMPYISQVAIGKKEKLRVFGNDYPTIDGTGVRDFIHVTDLAKGHVAALKYLFSNEKVGFCPFNLGRGEGISVLQLVNAFEQASGRTIPYEFVDRRPGDVAECYADPTLANTKLDWKAELGIKEMCEDAWRWQKNNPNGYRQ